MSATTQIEVPAGGAKIVAGDPTPDNPIIPFIEGDGIGVDITPAMQAVVDFLLTLQLPTPGSKGAEASAATK